MGFMLMRCDILKNLLLQRRK